jgi:dTDP-4-amino-4,6-dideoxygalactose transaminase
MIPRYTPSIDVRAWLAWMEASFSENAGTSMRNIGKELGSVLPPYHYAFNNLRTGLHVYLTHLRRTSGLRNQIVVSSQICIAVPLAVEAAGFTVRYVDIDNVYPTPSADDFAAAIDEHTAGVVVAPMYGHIQAYWRPLLAALGERALVLDLAQGLGLEQTLATLYQRADVVGFSFGLGKGLDAGGGLVYTRSELTLLDLPRQSRLAALGPLAQALVLRAAINVGASRLLAEHLNRHGAEDAAATDAELLGAFGIDLLWQTKLRRFRVEIEHARARASLLGEIASLCEKLRDTEVYFSPTASHLRQVIRLKDADQRDRVLEYLRKAGIDCAAAGEPLPAAGTPGENLAVNFPNASRFQRDAIRLPFLGRMTEARFKRFRTILERTLVKHLS